MIFTDDDLKRLKAKEGYWYSTIPLNKGQSASWGFVDGDKIDAVRRDRRNTRFVFYVRETMTLLPTWVEN